MATLDISRKELSGAATASRSAAWSAASLSALTAAEVDALAGRLERDDYANPFEALDDWHLLRAIALQRPDLTGPHAYLLDFSNVDEV